MVDEWNNGNWRAETFKLLFKRLWTDLNYLQMRKEQSHQYPEIAQRKTRQEKDKTRVEITKRNRKQNFEHATLKNSYAGTPSPFEQFPCSTKYK